MKGWQERRNYELGNEKDFELIAEFNRNILKANHYVSYMNKYTKVKKTMV